MSISRYQNDPTVRNGKLLRTASAVYNIRRAVRNGNIPFKEITLKAGQRLDHLAFSEYGDGRLWWVIAACSNIGWAMQAPAGTIVRIPTNITDALGFI